MLPDLLNDYRFIVLPLINHTENNREECTLVLKNMLYRTLSIKINSSTGDVSVINNAKKRRVFQYIGDLTKYHFLPEAEKSSILEKVADAGKIL